MKLQGASKISLWEDRNIGVPTQVLCRVRVRDVGVEQMDVLIDQWCKCLSLVGGLQSLVKFWATQGLSSLRRWCTVGVDRHPPSRSHIQGDVTAERQPFVVGVVLKSYGLGRGHHGERCVHTANS